MSRTSLAAFVLPALLAVAALFVPIALPAGYHDFADHAAIGGLHHIGDTFSNLGFLAAGLFVLWRARTATEIWLAAALGATCLGSWYYHLQPDDARLLMDRIPMAPAFAAMAGIMLFDRDERLALTYTAVLSMLFTAAAAYALTSGNQSFWIAAQVYLLLLLVVTAIRRPPMRASAIAAFALYAAAKICEGLDHEILHLTGFISGHTIKHLLAALAPVAWYVLWRREKGESWIAQRVPAIVEPSRS